MDWREIHSAPMEGEVIVDLWRDGDRFTEAWWSGERWISYSSGDYKDPGGGNWYVIDLPTHWMPLPDGPYPEQPTEAMHAAFHSTALEYGHLNLSYAFCRAAWRAMLHAHYYAALGDGLPATIGLAVTPVDAAPSPRPIETERGPDNG